MCLNNKNTYIKYYIDIKFSIYAFCAIYDNSFKIIIR